MSLRNRLFQKGEVLMSHIFHEILNTSIWASYLIVVVIVIRIFLKQLPKWSRCLLWAMVAVRLIMPFEIESRFSLLPEMKNIKSESYQNTNNYISALKDKDLYHNVQYQQNINEYINSDNSELYYEIEENAINAEATAFPDKNRWDDLIDVFSFVWLMGIAAFLIYAVYSFVKLKRKVAVSILLQDNVYLCDEIDSSFVMGICKPCIYLSSRISKDAWESILAHENTHIKRGDHIWKLLGYLLLMVYWFNPLSWFAYMLFCKDMELACDEKLTQRMNKKQRTEYCEALLKCSRERKSIDACPVAFGEIGIKERVTQVLNYKKPSFWITALAFMICAIVLVCFMTNPKDGADIAGNSENEETVTDINSNLQGQESLGNVTEYDHILPDEQGYRWLTEEKDVYAYEFKDLDGNGVEEYAKVYLINTEQEYICRYVFYWNEEAIYEYENSYGMSPGEAEYLDLDGDGGKELFLTFWPHVNSMPLQEYIVLKQQEEFGWEALEMIHGEEVYDNAFPISVIRGKNEWEAVISCKGLEKTVSFDIAKHHSMLLDRRKEAPPEEKEYWIALIHDYKYGYPEESEWYSFGSVCAWGIWNIKSGEYNGQPCLIATHGIQGFDKTDIWGDLDVYFNYDAQGKVRFLNMEFYANYSMEEILDSFKD